jgi:hypothetical protein
MNANLQRGVTLGLPLTDAQEGISETVVEKLFQFIIKGAQFALGSIKALSLGRSQQFINLLADKCYAVVGSILRSHETAVFVHVGAYCPLETGAKELPFVVYIDNQVCSPDMVFPAFAALPKALRAYPGSAHLLADEVHSLLA